MTDRFKYYTVPTSGYKVLNKAKVCKQTDGQDRRGAGDPGLGRADDG